MGRVHAYLLTVQGKSASLETTHPSEAPVIARLFLAAFILTLLYASGFHPSSRAQAETFVFETQMYGQNQVPPVNTVGWGFFRFFFNEDRTAADVTVDLKGLAGDAVVSADIHRGKPGTNGPVVKHLADGGYIVTSVRVTFTRAEIEEMAAGDWYISLKTTSHPNGELRGQIEPPPGFLPTPEPPALPPVASTPEPQRPAVVIRPPDTGDAGLR